MKILITGVRGQLGADCLRVFYPGHTVHGMGPEMLDIRDPDQVHECVGLLRPDAVINCAAFTAVDQCETDQDQALAVNATGPENLARAVRRFGGLLMHVSTDYVFDGARQAPEPYTEDDAPNPLSVYGRSKLAGEEAVRALCPNHVIVRTAWMYGARGRNFLKTMLRLSLEDPQKPRLVVHDQHGSPTWSLTLARQMQALVESGAWGLFHAASQGHCTWFELGSYFLGKMGLSHNLAPCTSEQYPALARRPANSILDNKKLRDKGLDRMPPWQDAVDAFILENKKKLLKEAKEAVKRMK